MAHRRFEFDMPAPADVVFDAFHFHVWRARWDSLVGSSFSFSRWAACTRHGASAA